MDGFGERLREARERKRTPQGRRWTQVDLAREIEVAPNTVARWENSPRRPRDIAKLPRIAQALGVSVEWLVGGSDVEATETGTPRVTSGETGLPNGVRTWLQEELLQYTKAGVPHDAVREAQQLYESPEVFTFFRHGEQRERSEADVLKGMKGMSVAIRSTLLDRGYKVGPNREE